MRDAGPYSRNKNDTQSATTLCAGMIFATPYSECDWINDLGGYTIFRGVRQEVYGNQAAGWLLSAFSRLFTVCLQSFGFTCGMVDIVLTSDANAVRAENLKVPSLPHLFVLCMSDCELAFVSLFTQSSNAEVRGVGHCIAHQTSKIFLVCARFSNRFFSYASGQ